MSLADVAERSASIWALNNPTGTRGLVAVDKLGNKIRFFDPGDFREIARIDARNHHELAISADHTLAYATDWGLFRNAVNVEPGRQISVIDLASRTIVDRIDTGPYATPHGMRLDDRGLLWVIFEDIGVLAPVDLAARKIGEGVTVAAAGTRPHFIEILPDGSKLYISCKKGPIVVFDLARREVAGEIAVASGTEGLAVAPDGTRLIVAENSVQDLLVIDTTSDRIVERVAIEGAVLSNPARSRLVRVQFSPDGRHLVSTNFVSGVVHIHDAARPAEHVMLPVAKGPQGMAFTADGARVVVANHDSGIATIIDLARKKATGWFEAGQGIETLAFY